MNPIQYAMNTLLQGAIPHQLLEYAFQATRSRYGTRMHSLEEEIRRVIIDGRVLFDVNLLGGTEIFIPLDRCKCELVDQMTYVYHIDPLLTQNRPIMQVYDVTLGAGSWMATTNMYTGDGGAYFGGSAMGRNTSSLVNAAQGPISISTSDVNIVGHNTVMIRFTSSYGRNLFLRCRVGDDDQLSSIRPQSYQDFANLVVWATKSYLYSNHMIEVDEGLLQGGQSLGVYRDILSSYSDAEERYNELKEEWRQIAIYNDPNQRRRQRQAMIRKF